MNTKTKATATEVIAAIKGSGGIKMHIARKLGVNRLSVDNYLKRWPSVQEAYDAEVESLGDMAESVVVTNIRLAEAQQKELGTQQDASDARWYLARKCRNRGYADRSEVTGADGEPLIPVSTVLVHQPLETESE